MGRRVHAVVRLRRVVSPSTYQRTLIPRTITMKHIAQSTTGPAAPLNLNPSPSNSIGPSVDLRTSTTHRAPIEANGILTMPAKCCCRIVSVQAFSDQMQCTRYQKNIVEKTAMDAIRTRTITNLNFAYLASSPCTIVEDSSEILDIRNSSYSRQN